MKPIDKLLPRLAKVREVASSQWVARCPAHADQHPSLRIRELDDGKVLLKCWAGCSAQDICGAVGLALRDLFVSDGYTTRNRWIWSRSTFPRGPQNSIIRPRLLVSLKPYNCW